MSIEASIILFISLLSIYLLVIEIFTVVFRLTGLTIETAHFQSVSLLTGAGFTTTESEIITTTKTRRRIAKTAMLFGYMFSVFLAGTIISLFTSMSTTEVKNTYNLIYLIVGLVVIIYLFFKNKYIKQSIDNNIKKIIGHILLKKGIKNPYYILESYSKMVICELLLTEIPEEIEGKTIIESNIRNKYGISYLTITRNNESREIKPFEDVVKINDKLVLYGKVSAINKLFKAK